MRLEERVLNVRKRLLDLWFKTMGEGSISQAQNIFTLNMFQDIIDKLIQQRYSIEDIINLSNKSSLFYKYRQ